MITDINHNNTNLDYDNNESDPERLKALHRLGFKLVALTEEGLPSEPWTPIYENTDHWKESDFTDPAILSKFNNVASTAGKTHLKDARGNDLFLNALDVDSEYVSYILNMSIDELSTLYPKSDLKLKEFIESMNLQGKVKEHVNKKSLLEILIDHAYVTKTRKSHGYHFWWLSHIQNKSILSTDCKKEYEFEIKADKSGALCTVTSINI